MTARKSTDTDTEKTAGASDAAGAQSVDTASVYALRGHVAAAQAHLDIANGDAKYATSTYEEALDKGYLGASPAREITGLEDKGLTLQSGPDVPVGTPSNPGK